MVTFNFEKLRVWQKARELNGKIYQKTKDFPVEEKYGIKSQIRRASVSILLNLAEGSGKRYKKEQVRFYSIAYGSLMEVMAALLIAQDLNYMQEETVIELRPMIKSIAVKIDALSKSV